MAYMFRRLSRLSKHGTNLSRAVASVPAHGSNNSPSSISPSMALPAGQSISLDMLFGPSTSNGNSVPQNTSHGNQADMWDTQQQPISIGTATNAQQQGISLLDSLFADMSGSGRAVSGVFFAHAVAWLTLSNPWAAR